MSKLEISKNRTNSHHFGIHVVSGDSFQFGDITLCLNQESTFNCLGYPFFQVSWCLDLLLQDEYCLVNHFLCCQVWVQNVKVPDELDTSTIVSRPSIKSRRRCLSVSIMRVGHGTVAVVGTVLLVLIPQQSVHLVGKFHTRTEVILELEIWHFILPRGAHFLPKRY